MVAAAIPRGGVGHTLPLLFVTAVAEPQLRCALLANFNAIPFDFVARQKIGGTHMTYGCLKQLPTLAPSSYTAADLEFIVPRVLELTYTAWDMQPFAEDLGYDGPPFRWDQERRAMLRAELDAYYAYLYGLTREELCYILDPKAVKGEDFPSETFRVLKKTKRCARSFGEYRTQRLVLEAFDRFASDDTFDPARLQDPIYFPVLQKAYAEKSRAYAESAGDPSRPSRPGRPAGEADLFLEGRSDVPVIEAAWSVFFPGQPMPFAVLAAGGRRRWAASPARARHSATCSATGSFARSPTTTATGAGSGTTGCSGRAVSGVCTRMASGGACFSRATTSAP